MASDTSGDERSRLQEVFDAALDYPVSERRSFAAVACAGDCDLHTRVLRLLAAHEIPSGPLDLALSLVIAPLMAEDDADPGRRATFEDSPDSMIGPYRIVRLLGRGGMGTVYLAERADGAFEQRVALKVVSAGSLTEELERRFLRERQILARLDHPGIARLLHGGLTPDGHPYLAMEYVEGESITEWVRGRNPDLPTRLRLLLQACDAVEYAHGQLVVHRDLKPSNILVTPEGRVRLLDFGIARLMAEREDELSTRTGYLLLTPEYAAPELLRGESINTSTDTYALGVILYEVLTGHRPFAEEAHSLADLLRIAEREPPLPSRTSDLAPARRREIEGDIDAIVAMAMRPEPERRYRSVEAFADDIRAFLGRRPVVARPDTRLYRSSRFLRRHRGAVAAGAALLLAIVAGLIGTTRMATAARQEAARTEAVRGFLFSLWEAADPARHEGNVPSALDLVDRGATRADSLTVEAGPEVRVDMLTTLGFLYGKLGEYERAVSMFERAVTEARQSFGFHERTGGALDGLAGNLYGLGRIEEAERAILESIEIRRAAGSSDTALAGSYSTLGGVYSTLGRFEEARNAHLAALQLDRRAAGSQSLAVAIDLNNLGAVTRRLGSYDDAEHYLRESVRIHRELARDLPGLATSLTNLGALRRDLDDLADAERLQREALALRERVLGAEHPDVAASLDHVGLTVLRAGRSHEADSLMSRAVELRRQTLGESHPETLGALNNLATVRFRLGEYERAAELQERVVAASRSADPNLEVPDNITMLHNLGVMRLRAGDLGTAERHLIEARTARGRVLGDRHPDFAVSMRWISELRRIQGRFPEAVEVGREALALLTSAFGETHARVAEAKLCVGAALVEQGRGVEAARLLREALAARQDIFPDGSLPVAEAMVWLGAALVRTGESADRGEARQLLDAARFAYSTLGRTSEPEAIRARKELAGL